MQIHANTYKICTPLSSAYVHMYLKCLVYVSCMYLWLYVHILYVCFVIKAARLIDTCKYIQICTNKHTSYTCHMQNICTTYIHDTYAYMHFTYGVRCKLKSIYPSLDVFVCICMCDFVGAYLYVYVYICMHLHVCCAHQNMCISFLRCICGQMHASACIMYVLIFFSCIWILSVCNCMYLFVLYVYACIQSISLLYVYVLHVLAHTIQESSLCDVIVIRINLP
jgi:hypothetical protein